MSAMPITECRAVKQLKIASPRSSDCEKRPSRSVGTSES